MCRFDVRSLGALVAADQEQNQGAAHLRPVDPIPRPPIDLQFTQPAAQIFIPPRIACFQSVDPDPDAGAGLNVGQVVKPIREGCEPGNLIDLNSQSE